MTVLSKRETKKRQEWRNNGPPCCECCARELLKVHMPWPTTRDKPVQGPWVRPPGALGAAWGSPAERVRTGCTLCWYGCCGTWPGSRASVPGSGGCARWLRPQPRLPSPRHRRRPVAQQSRRQAVQAQASHRQLCHTRRRRPTTQQPGRPCLAPCSSWPARAPRRCPPSSCCLQPPRCPGASTTTPACSPATACTCWTSATPWQPPPPPSSACRHGCSTRGWRRRCMRWRMGPSAPRWWPGSAPGCSTPPITPSGGAQAFKAGAAQRPGTCCTCGVRPNAPCPRVSIPALSRCLPAFPWLQRAAPPPARPGHGGAPPPAASPHGGGGGGGVGRP